MSAATSPARSVPRSRLRTWAVRAGIALLVLLLAAVAAGVIWAEASVHPAEAAPLRRVETDPAITVRQTDSAMVLTPAAVPEPEVGLVFYPGAAVPAEAYAARLSGLVTERHMSVVVVKPWLHLALFDRRPLDTFVSQAPTARHWMVGGHSMGGVRACQVADQVDALVLMASYCANDLSDSDVRVLSLSGSEDHLATPEKIAAARHLLPADAEMVQIPGASHASFGDYGPQAGDGTASISDAAMDQAVEQNVMRQ